VSLRPRHGVAQQPGGEHPQRPPDGPGHPSRLAGGGWLRLDILNAELAVDSTGDDLFALDEALTRLAASHPRLARLVHLRFFLGMTLGKAAGSLRLQARTAYRDWAYARGWVRRELDRDA
jgi:hypothetical protein